MTSTVEAVKADAPTYQDTEAFRQAVTARAAEVAERRAAAEEAERRMRVEVLTEWAARHRGNGGVTATDLASILGVSKTRLYQLAEEYGITM